MFSNYFRTAIRNLLRHKMHAALNLAGLSIGLACCLLIALYIAGELRYDRQHLHADRIWRVNRTFLDANGDVSLRLSSIAPPFAGHLQSEFPEIERITRFLWNGSAIRAGENVFQENNTLFADSNFFKVFTVPMLQGNPETALSAPWQVVLSEKTARRYFGDKNPLDQTIRLNNQFNFKEWLADFAYRIDMQWWMFALAGLAAVLIAFLTVSFQAVKAALANPVQSLRNE